ncbi:hypothetical protein CANARDRAFT_200550 [[Candida] arabinofermentans NRRL YB-2248]|uniref:Phosphoribosylglycinamide formyltransferase n=1 Tax=[Candida] arabinofermentans NRRL YB-2248 TaxID=983967 RepID=A0A1E4SYK2_9ASCO|nr:hypothetical protein CANARDRAFT_200550 [[Candida] arabinofermentans NRRL YB-2248]
MSKPKVLVLISGNGSNLQALIDNQNNESCPYEINHVISSSSKAYGLQRASNHNIPTTIHELKTYYKGIPKENVQERQKARLQFNLNLIEIILDLKPNLIVCAGWMLILSSDFLKPLNDVKIPIINLHPALPGQFEGTCAIERSYEAGQKGLINEGGVMVHYVIEQVDLGEPLVISKINVIEGESLQDWELRIHNLEHDAIVKGTLIVLKKII